MQLPIKGYIPLFNEESPKTSLSEEDMKHPLVFEICGPMIVGEEYLVPTYPIKDEDRPC